MKGILIALAFFVLGLLVANLPAQVESRRAFGGQDFSVVQHVPFNAISVYPDQAIVRVPGLQYAQVVSNSMAPVITEGSTVLERKSAAAEDIQVNDTISFY